jgi:cytochrome d ubiquinol oxidase subunit II
VVLNGVSVNGFLKTWLSPFCIIVGCFAVSLFAYLAAVYLTVEANTQELQEAFRRRALAAGVAVAVFALLTFFSASSEAVQVKDALMSRPWSWLEQGATAVVSICGFWTLWRRKFLIARFAVAVQVSFILLGWALAQYPFLVRPLLTIQNSSTSHMVLRDLLFACLAGAVVLLPSLRYLYQVFKANPEAMHSKPLH